MYVHCIKPTDKYCNVYWHSGDRVVYNYKILCACIDAVAEHVYVIQWKYLGRPTQNQNLKTNAFGLLGLSCCKTTAHLLCNVRGG